MSTIQTNLVDHISTHHSRVEAMTVLAVWAETAGRDRVSAQDLLDVGAAQIVAHQIDFAGIAGCTADRWIYILIIDAGVTR